MKSMSFILKRHGSLRYIKQVLPARGSERYPILYACINGCQLSSAPRPLEKEEPNLIYVASRGVIVSEDSLVRLRTTAEVPKRQYKEATDAFVIRDFTVGETLQQMVSLSKIRLTSLVVITTMAGYAMAPVAFSASTLAFASVGTGLTSCSANAINQFLEIPYDSQMNRTKNRVLVRGHLSPSGALAFAALAGVAGVSTLYFGCGAWSACLGALNLFLYTSVYTPMKRYHIANTWVGSIVGAIPPIMGWTAATGTMDTGALLLGALLYSWQFPHFNALSWNLRPDYSRAGYRMMSVTDPDLCRRVALRHSIVLMAMCMAAPLTDVVTWTFAMDTIPLNAYLVYCSYKFYKNADSKTSRKLFRLSLIHLPALVFLMIVSKKWTREEEKKHEEVIQS